MTDCLNNSSIENINNVSVSSTSSCASDISSLYFDELNEWSPSFSDNQSIDSNYTKEIDWSVNLPDLSSVRKIFVLLFFYLVLSL